MSPNEITVAWKKLVGLIDKIQDPVLKKSMLSEMAMRARRDWGYCPDVREIEDPKLELEDWEQDFLEEVKVGQLYGIPPKKTDLSEMRRFVREGGKISDLPPFLQTPYIIRDYLEVLFEEGRDLCRYADEIALQKENKEV